MKCPHCPDTTLVLSERQNVEIDYCPQCRGIWLDRGELDKLLDKAAAQQGADNAGARRDTSNATRPVAFEHRDFADSDFGSGQRGGYRRKKSWLSDIFD
jgi:hypothetical protein